jgi:hypothetical protein
MQKRTSEMSFSGVFASIHVVRIFFWNEIKMQTQHAKKT